MTRLTVHEYAAALRERYQAGRKKERGRMLDEFCRAAGLHRKEGFFLTTLTAVDVATGWTELQPVWGMGMSRVGSAIHHVSLQLPFPLRELHTDNGGEFINHGLRDWSARRGVHFTRGRSYRKNDQAYVEQRNWLSVRRLVGYDRYSSRAAFQALGQLYPLLRLQGNFFRPVRKLVGKERRGARVTKL